MVEEFSKMLSDGKDDQSFSVHKATQDSSGAEAFLRVDKETVARETQMAKLAGDVAEEIGN